MKTAREVALEALLKVNRGGGYSNLVLDKLIQRNQLNEQDSAFATALFFGVLERMVTIDYILAFHSKTPLRKLTPAVREILRMGIYQLLFMASVPDSAAVNESVELVKSTGRPRAAGYVNGVLRSFIRAGKEPPPLEGGEAGRLSILYSCPQWLVQLLLDSYGQKKTRLFLSHSLDKPPLFIRVNTQKVAAADLISRLESEGAKAVADPDLPGCLRLEYSGHPAKLPSFEEGLFHVQDKSSQLCVLALNPKPGHAVLDICAAPGGKSFTAAQLMEDTGHIVAADLYLKRTGLIDTGAKRLGLSCIQTRVWNAAELNPTWNRFDRVLCDVPCSGFGVMRRKPEVKYKSPEGLKDLSKIQYKILENSSHYVRGGGILVYSTCTLNPKENEEIVDRFLRYNPAFIPGQLPEALGEGWRATLIGRADCDGFFIAIMEKKVI